MGWVPQGQLSLRYSGSLGILYGQWVVGKSPELAGIGVSNSELGMLLRLLDISGSGHTAVPTAGPPAPSWFTFGVGQGQSFRADLVVTTSEARLWTNAPHQQKEISWGGERSPFGVCVCVCVHEVHGMMVYAHPESGGGGGTRALGVHVLGTQGRS